MALKPPNVRLLASAFLNGHGQPLMLGFRYVNHYSKCLYVTGFADVMKCILNDANEDTLAEVTKFIGDSGTLRYTTVTQLRGRQN